MATYVVLADYTEKGITNVADSLKRTDAVKETAKKLGITMKDSYWTLGTHDVVAIFEAPNDEAMTALGLSIGKQGYVRTQTLRAFSAAEMKNIFGKVV